MAKEILNLEVNSNIKGVTKDMDSLATSLAEARRLEFELTAQIKIKDGVLIDIERDLIKLKATQDSMPKGVWWKGQEELNQKIRDRTTAIKLERNALKDLKNQQKNNNDEIKTTEENIKGINAANKAGTPISKLARNGLRGIGTALKAMGIGLIVSALLLLKRAFMSNEKIMKAVEKVTTIISNVMTDVVDVFTNVYDSVTQSSDRFDALKTVLTSLMTIALTSMKLSFYSIKLAIQALMLAWEDSFLGGGDEGKIAELRADMAETAGNIKEIGQAAIDAGKDIVENIVEAAGEFGEIASEIGEGLKGVFDKGIDGVHRLTEEELEALKELERKKKEAHQAVLDRIEDERKALENLRKEEVETYEDMVLELMKLRATSSYAEGLIDIKAWKTKSDLRAEETAKAKILAAETLAASRTEATTDAFEKMDIAQDLADEIIKINLEKTKGLDLIDQLFFQKVLDNSDKLLATVDGNEKKKTQIISDSNAVQLAAYGQLAGALGKLAGDNKELAAAQAIIQTYLGANQALGSAPPPANFIMMAAVIAAGIANVQKIYATDVGGTTGGTTPAVTTPPAPQMMSGAFELTGGQPLEPTRAYVVSDDITNNQNKLAIIRRRATI